MRVGVLGRTRALLDSIPALLNTGFQVSFIATAQEESYYNCSAYEYQKYAELLGIPYYFGKSQSKLIELATRTQSDIAVSVNWPYLIREELLSCFRYGILNGHCGDLPRYRGNATVSWAIINGEKSIAFTVHLMDQGLDSGPVYTQRVLTMSAEAYIGEVYEWMNTVAPLAFVESLQQVAKNIAPVKQDSTVQVIRCFPRRDQDYKITWSQEVSKIYALIRSYSSPFPGAYCTDDRNREIRILKARPIRVPYIIYAVPGQICELRNGCPLVACRDCFELLLIEEVTIDGRFAPLNLSMRSRLF